MMPKKFPVTCHTDYVQPGSTFVAIAGMSVDGVAYIPQAIKNGASVIVLAEDAQVSVDTWRLMRDAGVEVQRVPDTRKALAVLSAQAAGYPARQLKIIGVTGTKGKTTTTFLLAHVLQGAGKKVGLVSTVHNRIMDTIFPPALTTPQPDYLQQFLRCCVDAQVEYVVMEVAAQALSLHRVHDILFDGVIFTNFSHEHLEFYPTIDAYFAAKCLIFDQVKNGAPVLINMDDALSVPLIQNQYKGFGFHGSTVIKTEQPCTIMCDDVIIACPVLLGSFNCYNILGAARMALALGIRQQDVVSSLAYFSGVPGRLQQFSMPNGARCIIDYAHNPSSYEAVLSMLRAQTDDLIVVFGAGGQRDPHKRPIMGKIASTFADTVILTSDNPRTEDPLKIMEDIAAGIEHKYKVIYEVDRQNAINLAYKKSRAGSIIAILGKGTDEYQIVGSQKKYFSERQIIQALY